jgi:hypothetical protein
MTVDFILPGTGARADRRGLYPLHPLRAVCLFLPDLSGAALPGPVAARQGARLRVVDITEMVLMALEG